MRDFVTIFFLVLFIIITSSSTQTNSAIAAETKDGFIIVGKSLAGSNDDFFFTMGEILPIRVNGSYVTEITTAWEKNESITLYFDGVPITQLDSPPQKNKSGGGLLLHFILHRDAQDDKNRQAWDRLFKSKKKLPLDIKPAIAIGKSLLTPVQVKPKKSFTFSIASPLLIRFVFVAGVIIFLLSYWYLVTRTKMLREEGTDLFSLGKSQMAFWGLMIVLSFSGVWLLTGSMERIPPQSLILLGISGATGLGSLMIDNNKYFDVETKINEYREQEQELLEEKTNASESFSPASQLELTDTRRQIKLLEKQLVKHQTNGFWRDICSDGKSASFYRLQVVIWTIVLGAVFIRTVAQVISMPEFPETLLTLMGISNATYLGFKIPEKV